MAEHDVSRLIAAALAPILREVGMDDGEWHSLGLRYRISADAVYFDGMQVIPGRPPTPPQPASASAIFASKLPAGRKPVPADGFGGGLERWQRQTR